MSKILNQSSRFRVKSTFRDILVFLDNDDNCNIINKGLKIP